MEQNKADYDVLIMGAGPAGLTAAHGLAGTGLSVALIDSGKALCERNRYAGTEITQGTGGSGLFSDGKFSFYPSASKLWALDNEARLRRAYNQTSFILKQCGLIAPAFPEEQTESTHGNGSWQLKTYPSFYLSLNDRFALTEYLAQNSGTELLPTTTLEACSYDNQAGIFTGQFINNSDKQKVTFRSVVFAGGRFSPIAFPLSAPMEFNRVEIGFRIKQPGDQAFFQNIKQLYT